MKGNNVRSGMVNGDKSLGLMEKMISQIPDDCRAKNRFLWTSNGENENLRNTMQFLKEWKFIRVHNNKNCQLN